MVLPQTAAELHVKERRCVPLQTPNPHEPLSMSPT
jgi:hypothetical protein